MVVLRCLQSAPRLLARTNSRITSSRTTHAAFRAIASPPTCSPRRTYATPSGTKEVAVRDALNEALAEELESNPKVFVLGEEVAQYNGA